MLSRLLEVSPTVDLSNLEETRVRASNLLCKVHTYMHTHTDALSSNWNALETNSVHA